MCSQCPGLPHITPLASNIHFERLFSRDDIVLGAMMRACAQFVWRGAVCVAVILPLMLGGFSGCSTDGYAADSNLRLTEEEQLTQPVLDRRDQRRIIAAMKTISEGHTPINPPATAPLGVRWSDVKAAARLAATETDMGVFGIDEDDDQIVIHLRTVGDRPALLIVTRTHDDRVYESEATVGRFGDRTDKADELLKEFHDAMKAFGAKRQFNEETD